MTTLNFYSMQSNHRKWTFVLTDRELSEQHSYNYNGSVQIMRKTSKLLWEYYSIKNSLYFSQLNDRNMRRVWLKYWSAKKWGLNLDNLTLRKDALPKISMAKLNLQTIPASNWDPLSEIQENFTLFKDCIELVNIFFLLLKLPLLTDNVRKHFFPN